MLAMKEGMQSRTFSLYFTCSLLVALLAPQLAGAATTNTTFKIGLVRDMFLRYATSDSYIWQAADYWADWVNNNGGIYYGDEIMNVEVITKDANSADPNLVPSIVASKYQEMVDEGINIALSPFTGLRSAAGIAVTEKYDIIHFSATPTLANYYGITTNFAFYWLMPLEIPDMIAQHIPKDSVKNFVVIMAADNTPLLMGQRAQQIFTANGWQQQGVVIVNTSASSDSSGLESQFRQAIANATAGVEVDVFVMSISPDQITQAINGFTGERPNVKCAIYLIPTSIAVMTSSQLQAGNWVTFTPFDASFNLGTSGIHGGTAAEFTANFIKRYGNAPDYSSAILFASLMGYWMVANETRSKNSTVLRDAMLAHDTIDLFTGPLKYTSNFTVNPYPAHPYQVENGTVIKLESAPMQYPVVWPWSPTITTVIKKGKNNTKLLVAIIVPVGIAFIIGLLIGIMFILRQRKKVVNAMIKTEEGERRAYKIDTADLEISTLLGEGSFGLVYKGEYRGADVAVKKLKHQKMNKQQLDEFAQESAVMVGLRHPNIVLFMGVCMEPANLCVITELMGRGSLYDVIHDANYPLPYPLVMKLSIDILKGLQFIHSSGFIHRDMKSLNLLVDSNWNIKIADFGLSCAKAAAGTGAQVSLLWTAPEILLQEKNCYSERSDLYAVGIIFWEMLARENPFADVNSAAIHNAIVSGKRPKIESSWDDQYTAVMSSCWSQKVTDRPSVREVRQKLENIALPTIDRMPSLSFGDSSGSLFGEKAPQGNVTLVFTDVQSSTELWEHDPRVMMRALGLHNEVFRTWIKRLQGYEVKTEGDSFMIAFSDPINAVNFCLRTQMDLLKTNWPSQIHTHHHANTVTEPEFGDPMYHGLRVRMGIHNGEPLCKNDPITGRMDYFGPVVNVAARVSGYATGGQIFIGPDMYPLITASKERIDPFVVENLGCRVLKGLKEPVNLYRIAPQALKSRLVDVKYAQEDTATQSFYPTTDGSNPLMNLTKEKWILNYEDIKMGPEIGSGSFGHVYSGELDGKKVAVKTFLKKKVSDNIVLDMRMESAILSELDHPNIIKFFGSCIKSPNLCLVSELVERGNLSDILYNLNIPLSWNQRMHFALNIAEGMNYLHKHNIIHRDVKSANMLVSLNWDVKIADFGFSRMKADNQTMTQCGTVAWTAPEIFAGVHYTEKADVYGFGVILWEILCRKKPWEGMHAMKIVQAVTGGSKPPQDKIPYDHPPILKQLMISCCEITPEDRPSFEKLSSDIAMYI